ncbi:MAG: hypothetical protein KJZ75_11480 [Hyphomonadaceae bacterium]|nr:hypothetical protein [Hyphomonadaceae bacterium]
MKRPRAYMLMPPAPTRSPLEAELDRLIELRNNGYITERDYLRDSKAVKAAMKAEERRR